MVVEDGSGGTSGQIQMDQPYSTFLGDKNDLLATLPPWVWR